ncbi:MAG: hypothetical protein ACFCBU_15300 [Cyanophyceae cyanobacterium]
MSQPLLLGEKGGKNDDDQVSTVRKFPALRKSAGHEGNGNFA